MAKMLVAPPMGPTIAAPSDPLAPPTRPQPAPPKLQALTALRFFAAAMIVMLHAQGYFGNIDALAQFTLTQGVCFFYVLSGFILAYAYPRLDRPGIGRFWVGRFARIVPLNLVALLLYVLILPAWYRDSVSDSTPLGGVLSLFLLQSWIPVYRIQTAFNGVAWSLSAECFFYVCFPLLIWRWRQTWALKLFLAFALVCGMIALANFGLPSLPPTVEVRDLVYFHPLARIWEFVLGIATAHLWRYLQPRLHYGRALGTLLEAAVLGGTLYVLASSGEWAHQAGQTALIGPGGEAWLASSGWVCLPFAAVILIVGLERGWIARLLSLRPLVLLGEISFALYLLQLLFCHLYVLHPEPFMSLPPWLLHVGYWFVVLLAAYLGWALVETPSRHAIVRVWERHIAPAIQRNQGTPKEPARRRVARSEAGVWKAGNLVAAAALVGAFVGLAVIPGPTLPAAAALDTLPATQGRARIEVDMIGKHPIPADQPVVIARADYPSDAVTVEGWAIDQEGQQLARGVLVSLDDEAGTWADYGSTRNDVSDYLGDPRFLRSGYIGVLSLKGVSDGLHTVTVKSLVPGTDTYSETTRSFLLH